MREREGRTGGRERVCEREKREKERYIIIQRQCDGGWEGERYILYVNMCTLYVMKMNIGIVSFPVFSYRIP